uniref:Uncharacterized protein n=1 Tax=Romanomermis culicivorax TaxID=13658 RepID=A0A915K3V6_ROMCU
MTPEDLDWPSTDSRLSPAMIEKTTKENAKTLTRMKMTLQLSDFSKQSVLDYEEKTLKKWTAVNSCPL